MQILTIIMGVLKFWDQVTFLVKLLEKTPIEKRQEVMKRLQNEKDAYSKPDGRPTWN
jgi:hypothetical protein